MELEQLIQLIGAVSESKLTDFCYEENGVKLCLKKEAGAVAGMIPALPGVQTAADLAVTGAVQTVSGAAGSVQAITGAAGTVQTLSGAEATAVQVTTETAAPAIDGKIVKSPLVGVFYAAPAEDAKPYVSVGDTVKKGQILACVEAMKLMNEIESEYDGVVAEILVENGQGVGYGEPLFVIR